MHFRAYSTSGRLYSYNMYRCIMVLSARQKPASQEAALPPTYPSLPPQNHTFQKHPELSRNTVKVRVSVHKLSYSKLTMRDMNRSFKHKRIRCPRGQIPPEKGARDADSDIHEAAETSPGSPRSGVSGLVEVCGMWADSTGEPYRNRLERTFCLAKIGVYD